MVPRASLVDLLVHGTQLSELAARYKGHLEEMKVLRAALTRFAQDIGTSVLRKLDEQRLHSNLGDL